MCIEAEIAAELISASEENRMPQGLLFHGTVEDISGPLRQGGDGVLWTTDNPRIAQQYMPASGMSAFFGAMQSYERDMRIRPVANMPWFEFAKSVTGITDDQFDIRFDRIGQVDSYRVPSGWLTYGEAERILEEQLGYAPGKDHWVKTSSQSGATEFHSVDYTMPGQIYVTLAAPISFRDARRSDEGDLGDPDHLRGEVFAAAEERGYEGIVINDFCQTDHFGNVGHTSYGILPNRLNTVEWIAVPSTRKVIEVLDEFQTLPAELVSWAEQTQARLPAGLRL